MVFGIAFDILMTYIRHLGIILVTFNLICILLVTDDIDMFCYSSGRRIVLVTFSVLV